MQMLPHFILEIDDETEGLGIQEVSYVEAPATGLGMLCFSEEAEKNSKFAKLEFEDSEFQRMTSGVLMMPGVKYLRQDANGNYYTVEFSAETLQNALIKYLKEDKGNSVKLEHSGDPMSGFKAIEHWIISNPNTRSPIFKLSLSDLGYDPTKIPVGTIMKTTYIADESFWNEYILTGKVSGYSLGGFFELIPVAVEEFMKKEKETKNDKDVDILLNLFKTQEISLKDINGAELLFKDNKVFKNQHGELLAADGEYMFSNDLLLIVKEGYIVDAGFEKVEEKCEDCVSPSEEEMIEENFSESYSDYPESAKKDAQKALDVNKSLGNKCATLVGKARANQIAKGEPLSLETVKRTYSYLSRAKEYDKNDWESCGTISYNLWGGDSMLDWCKKVIEEYDRKKEEMSSQSMSASESQEFKDLMHQKDQEISEKNVQIEVLMAEIQKLTETLQVALQPKAEPIKKEIKKPAELQSFNSSEMVELKIGGKTILVPKNKKK